jgi:hypothetical protein
MRKNEKKLLPASIDLKNEVDLKAEAAAFELPLDRTREIADEVSESSAPVLEISITRRESELRERFEQLYDAEVAKRQECPFVFANGSACSHTFTEFDEALVHIRMHFIFDSGDNRLAESTLKHIEERVYPVEQHSMSAILPPDERKRLLAEHGARLMEAAAAKRKKSTKDLPAKVIDIKTPTRKRSAAKKKKKS